jgi:methyltransferase
MTWALAILSLVTLQRLSELIIAKRNTAGLMAKGAVEHGASHYPVMVLLHASWLAGVWWFGWSATIVWPFMALYIALQVFRVWILVTLGKRWTTRIITVPNETLVRQGPFQYLRHPNYALVLLEVPLLPLAFDLPWFAMLFGMLNVFMLHWRINIEDQALHQT